MQDLLFAVSSALNQCRSCRDVAQIELACAPGKYVQEGGGAKADKIRPVLKLMQLIGQLSGGRSVSQVALGYLMAKGAPCLNKATC
jgi:hypothetical protein